MFQLTNILLSALGSAVLVTIFLCWWKWSRDHFRFAFSSLSTFFGYTAWNLLQNATGADQALNIDWPILPVSWSDIGSGVVAFVVTVITLGMLTERTETAWRVVAASAIAGLLARLWTSSSFDQIKDNASCKFTQCLDGSSDRENRTMTIDTVGRLILGEKM